MGCRQVSFVFKSLAKIRHGVIFHNIYLILLGLYFNYFIKFDPDIKNNLMRILLLLSLAFITGSIHSFAQDDKQDTSEPPGPPRTISMVKVTDSIYMLKGKGGNIGLAKGEDGVLMIDNQFAAVTPELLDLVNKLTRRPVQFLVNTHHHGDHTGGNKNVAETGAILVAQENVRKRMSTEQLMKAFSKTVPPSPEAAWPDITFQEDITFHMNGESVFIFHVHNAHTTRIVMSQLMAVFGNNSKLHSSQSGFRSRCCCMTQLVKLTSHFTKLLDE